MRYIFAALVGGASLMAVPAFAATGSASSQTPTNGPQSAKQIEHDLMASLSKAGYSDINVIPGSFLVHAKDSHGNPVEMMVSPNSITAVTAMNENGPSGAMHPNSNNGNEAQASNQASGSHSSSK